MTRRSGPSYNDWVQSLRSTETPGGQEAQTAPSHHRLKLYLLQTGCQEIPTPFTSSPPLAAHRLDLENRPICLGPLFHFPFSHAGLPHSQDLFAFILSSNVIVFILKRPASPTPSLPSFLAQCWRRQYSRSDRHLNLLCDVWRSSSSSFVS